MFPNVRRPNDLELKFLNSRGFTQLQIGGWKFVRDGYVFDLSAADLNQIETIFALKKFIVVDTESKDENS